MRHKPAVVTSPKIALGRIGIARDGIHRILFEDGSVVRKIPQSAEGKKRPGKTDLVVIVLFFAILESELQAVLGQRPAEGVAKTVGILGENTRRIFSLRRPKP